MAEWVSRKRKLPSNTSPSSTSHTKTTSTSAQATRANIPTSLLPHLAWTKLPCHKKPRSSNAGNEPTALQREVGRAIFFVPHPNTDLDTDRENDEDDQSSSSDVGRKMAWFQGRFFPSSSPRSPTSTTQLPGASVGLKSWGLLGIQTDVIDECLRCSEGGYRELDLTVIRYLPSGAHPDSRVGGGGKKAKCKFSNLTWTGGDMMTLSSDPYAVYDLNRNEMGIKFDPTTLIEGQRAVEVASKYFPALSKQISGDGSGDEEALVVIGRMEMVVPIDFVRKGNHNSQRRIEEEDDGLWDD